MNTLEIVQQAVDKIGLSRADITDDLIRVWGAETKARMEARYGSAYLEVLRLTQREIEADDDADFLLRYSRLGDHPQVALEIVQAVLRQRSH